LILAMYRVDLYIDGTIPASAANNKAFKHYYNVDVFGGFNANVRVDSFIEVNNNLFRAGVLELESVSLKDTFGEDTLNDLDLSAQDHTYNDTNIETGINAYVGGTDNAIIYPMITPVTRCGSDHSPNNISYHSGHNEHGVFYYDLKPAIKLQKIIDAIEAKYSITFNSDFFDSADFGKLFMLILQQMSTSLMQVI